MVTYCESCEIGGPSGDPEAVEATTHATCLAWGGYHLCDDCADHLNSLCEANQCPTCSGSDDPNGCYEHCQECEGLLSP
jgi:hypothetical protein